MSNEPPLPDPTHLVVLAIDDDSDALRLLQSHLKRVSSVSFKTHTFEDWRQALEELPRIEPDVLIFDHNLEDTTGLEVFDRVVQMGFTLPAILVTGNGQESLVRDALHRGFADYLPKIAVASASLERAITNAIDKHRLRARVAAQQVKQQRLVVDLQRRNAEIESFYHSLSHELKTPLTAIREFASLLLDGILGPLNESQADAVTTIHSATDRMTLNIDDLLDVTRIDTGKLHLDLEATSIESTIQHAVAESSAAAEKAGIDLGLTILEGCGAVEMDERRIVQVLVNLIGNAIKFTPRGGRITVSARPRATACDGEAREWVEVAVEDTGQGIEAGQVEAIFDRLVQSSESDAALLGGLGIGLHICRQLVSLHRGEISVESTPGEGSVFRFTLPLAPAQLVTR